MVGHHVCASCRLRRASVLQQQWRFLSQHSPTTAPVQERISQDAPEAPPLGRYSRRPLAPQQILNELRQPSTGKSTQPTAITQDIATSLSPDLQHKFRLFMSISRPIQSKATSDSQALRVLLDIARDLRGTDRFLALPADVQKPFARSYVSWLISMSGRWSHELFPGNLQPTAVSPIQAVRPMTAFKWPTYAFFHAVLWSLAANTLAAVNSKQLIPNDRIRAAVAELMLVWNLAMRVQLSPSTTSLDADLTDWSFLPEATSFAESLGHKASTEDRQRLSFNKAVQMLLPKAFLIPVENLQNLNSHGRPLHDYPSAALTTLDLLYQIQAEKGNEEWVAQYKDWMQLIGAVHKGVGDKRVPFALAQKLGDPLTGELFTSVVERFQLTQPSKRFQQTASYGVNQSPKSGPASTIRYVTDLSPGETQDAPSVQPVIPQSAKSTSGFNQQFITRCIARLGRAIEQQDLNAAKRVYEDAQRSLVKGEDRLPLDLYEHLLYTFISLRHRDVVAPIWNDMIRAGHQPTCKTFTVLMRGSQSVRDLEAMEGFWAKMKAARLQPDQYAWSTRLFGLMKSKRHISVGMRALGEMGREWVGAAQTARATTVAGKSKTMRKDATTPVNIQGLLVEFEGDVNGIPRPNIYVMNSAISALAATKHNMIPQVLAWGRSFGIEPDLITYNALINMAFRENLPQEAMTILKRMSEKGIEPNSTTWTVLLTAVFEGGTLDGMNVTEVGSYLEALIKDIETGSTGLDVKGYALCIDRLLKVYDNHEAAQSILRHMVSKGMQPTVEIYTILMTHYLQKYPPDFAAAESLWSRIRNDANGYGAALDTVFFDRMIELYAPHYSTVGMKTMLSFLDMAESQGKRLSWRAMEALARALAGAGERDKLSNLAAKASRERDGGIGTKDGFGHSSFWNFVASTGVLSGSGPGIGVAESADMKRSNGKEQPSFL